MGRYMRKCKGVVGEITVPEVPVSVGGACDQEMKSTRASKFHEEDESSSSSPDQNRKIKRTWTDGGESSAELMRSTRRQRGVSIAKTTETTTESSSRLPALSSGGRSSEEEGFISDSCCSSNVSGDVVEDRVEAAAAAAADPTDERDDVEAGTLTFSDARSERRTWSLLRIQTVESGVLAPHEEEESHNNNNNNNPVEQQHESEVNSGDVELTTRTTAARRTVEDEMPSEAEIEEFFASAEKDLQKCFTDKYNFDVVNDVPLGGRYDWVRIKP